jgi:uncharacterized protein YdhG (YjbR/CyaY superfamily)
VIISSIAASYEPGAAERDGYAPPMANDDGDRTRFFPAIVAKHGGPISIWLDRLAELGGTKYPEQIAYLRENHGFSQAHANALVMYVRNSPTSKRYATTDTYFTTLDPTAATTAKAIFAAVRETDPDLELVMAWNHPMLRISGKYVIGLSVAKHHLLVNPFSADVLTAFARELAGYEVNKKTFKVPLDWTVDADLLRAIVKARLAELF